MRGTLSAFSIENPHDGKTLENYTRFEWGVEVGEVTTFMLRLFVPHEFDMLNESVDNVAQVTNVFKKSAEKFSTEQFSRPKRHSADVGNE